ncbi:MAG: HAD family phosphatase [Deltaproteobacteria bacterium]|nr:HAD family phosphatase [Deltaproteobacteria bacterium]
MRAVLFDLDGTLVDNMPFHADAWVQMCARRGVHVPRDRFLRELAGSKNDHIVRLFWPDATDALVEELTHEKEVAYRAAFGPRLRLLAGAAAFLDRLERDGVPFAIASAAPLLNRALVLDGLGLRSRFAAIVGGEEVARGKPHPDIFLLAAERLGVAPRDCVVFEDAVLGVRAGVAADMRVVGVTTVCTPEELLAAGALHTIADFTQLPRGL